jgi:phage FluMu protein Com
MGRGAITDSRLSRDYSGNILYKLKRSYDDGTTHLRFSPKDFFKKLIALIPPPRSHLIRYHGVLAPNSKWRKSVVPKKVLAIDTKYGTRKYWIPWAKLLARVHYDHLTKCERCGHQLKIVDYFLSYQQAVKYTQNSVKGREPPDGFNPEYLKFA